MVVPTVTYCPSVLVWPVRQGIRWRTFRKKRPFFGFPVKALNARAGQGPLKSFAGPSAGLPVRLGCGWHVSGPYLVLGVMIPRIRYDDSEKERAAADF